MLNLLSGLVSTIFHIIKLVFSFCLSLVFVALPTLLLNPSEQIPYIEEDICIDFPKDYKVIEKYEDWIAFEQHQEMTFEFQQEEIDKIIAQQKITECINGRWIEKDNTLEFELNNSFVKENKYIFKAKLFKQERILEYYYSNI